ncbi:anthranilate phosphoribosyltransferase [Yamadazyma tenuis]|uniref:Anthranilate phosphoribosyltransferase n=1 Tax=Candida tenuis (strain ATCC 10573 / BCRC 21748 / CBS 615 / JCM 9827 / NBRC 10315 / NRRL Y-1498 / VKM Y-70) TaxID=590646 RepID=G3B9C1_CANTC|nr:anthranilate phosphoribosyltransferase [Yamadazyma tenuis ATCC 10573]EGV61862.1 anthranilate phosphoribosyltransferase [Yamadazyma tenuis ATCC 10573]WEJ93091.1 anthranilate phosphoribosyltransferase [Yamadazyma tenuis]
MNEDSSVLTPYIKKLIEHPPTLTPEDLSKVLHLVFEGQASEIQIAAFLTALRGKGLDHESEYIAAATNTVMKFSHPIAAKDVPVDGYVDVVGTGGDGQNTFNVSTASSIVAAGMGIPVCKHGGKASTSSSGSGDLLKSLGVDLLKANKHTAVKVLSDSKYTFLFAPAFHEVMAKVASVRKKLGVPTIFNILGPLMNPAPLSSRILGVYKKPLGEQYAKSVLQLTANDPVHKKSMVVYGHIGLDEISPVGITSCWIVENGQITYKEISPKDFDLPEAALDLVKSGTPEENAVVLMHILKQDSPEFKVHSDNKDNHPVLNYILMNSAALAVVYGLTDSYVEGVKLAKNSITSGTALGALESFKDTLNQL